jgi:hypothetical protein
MKGDYYKGYLGLEDYPSEDSKEGEKVYLLKNDDGHYLYLDIFEGWQTTCIWKFAYFFFTLEDAKQIKQFAHNFTLDSYRVVSRTL